MEATVQAVVEIIHAYTVCSLNAVPLAVRLYTELLLCTDTSVSFGAKQALIRVLRPRHKRRKVFIPSPPRCSTPGEYISVNVVTGSSDTSEYWENALPHYM